MGKAVAVKAMKAKAAMKAMKAKAAMKAMKAKAAAPEKAVAMKAMKAKEAMKAMNAIKTMNECQDARLGSVSNTLYSSRVSCLVFRFQGCRTNLCAIRWDLPKK